MFTLSGMGLGGEARKDEIAGAQERNGSYAPGGLNTTTFRGGARATSSPLGAARLVNGRPEV
jgi:hypothetical protein